MGRRFKTLFRRSMHFLASFALLLALASALFWLRSRTRYDQTGIVWNGKAYSIQSLDSRLGIGAERDVFPDGPFYRSDPWTAPSPYPWSYTQIETRSAGAAYTHYDFLGFRRWTYLFDKWQTSLQIPFSYLLLASLAFSTLWFRHAWRTRRRPNAGLCPKCGYDLRASPDYCPECGTKPADPNAKQKPGK